MTLILLKVDDTGAPAAEADEHGGGRLMRPSTPGVPVGAAVRRVRVDSGAAGCEPDLIAVNGRIYTVDPAAPWVEALAVCGERIVRTGTTRDIEALAGPRHARLELAGQTGRSRLQRQPRAPDRRRHASWPRSICATRSRRRRRRRVHGGAYVRTQPKGRWILGGFWDHESWPQTSAADARADRRRARRTTRSSCSGSTATWAWRTAWRCSSRASRATRRRPMAAPSSETPG